jgi:hypothetical protein
MEAVAVCVDAGHTADPVDKCSPQLIAYRPENLNEEPFETAVGGSLIQ